MSIVWINPNSVKLECVIAIDRIRNTLTYTLAKLLYEILTPLVHLY